MSHPVYTETVNSILPKGARPYRTSNMSLFDATADALTALITGANPGLALAAKWNCFTIVNNGAGVVSAIPHSGSAGTTYVVGDLVYVTQSGAVAGTLKVAAIGAAGAVTALTPVYRGTGYSTATNLATTTNSTAGSGLVVDIIAGADSVSLPKALAGMSVWVRNDSPADGVTKIVPHAAAAGTGYAVGDTVTWTQAGGSLGVAVVASIGASGAVTSLAVVNNGKVYTTAATGLVTATSGSGTALTVDITAGGNALAVFPATGDAINAGAANALYSLAQGKEISFRCYAAGTWLAALSN